MSTLILRVALGYALAAGICFSQSTSLGQSSKVPLTGVWQVTENSPVGQVMTVAEPGFFIFTRGYFSIVYIHADKPCHGV